VVISSFQTAYVSDDDARRSSNLILGSRLGNK
jgi:hypothetical protein